MILSEECELVLNAHAELGEGPIWDTKKKTLLWVDLLRGQVHRTDPATGVDETLQFDQPVGAAAVRAAGGLVLALRDGFAIKADGELQWIAGTEHDKLQNRMNDGKCAGFDSRSRLPLPPRSGPFRYKGSGWRDCLQWAGMESR